ncbi:hypothetical protein TRAPUB_5211 [Trametes pubescens]|uniref:Uncharacterized protein n=1 Tax=Trametes pubescens TaxID=154538 RepID=A0A1M2V933_TRAPU|nr:hypothetical protein TRAPUB_5211 [Trametes pubescens]
MEVDANTYDVFANLFSIGKGKKGALAWDDFAMTTLGFKYETKGGSKRQFTPPAEPPRPILRWDEAPDRLVASTLVGVPRGQDNNPANFPPPPRPPLAWRLCLPRLDTLSDSGVGPQTGPSAPLVRPVRTLRTPL